MAFIQDWQRPPVQYGTAGSNNNTQPPASQKPPEVSTYALGEEGGSYPRPVPAPPIYPPAPSPGSGGTSGYYGEDGGPAGGGGASSFYGENGYYPYPTPQPAGKDFQTLDVLKVVQEADGSRQPSQYASTNSGFRPYGSPKDGTVTQDELQNYIQGLSTTQGGVRFDPDRQKKIDIAQTLLNNYSFVANRDGLAGISFLDIVKTAVRDGNVYDFNTRTDLPQFQRRPWDFPIWTNNAPNSL